jgi:hypothetical protein
LPEYNNDKRRLQTTILNQKTFQGIANTDHTQSIFLAERDGKTHHQNTDWTTFNSRAVR